MFQSSPTSKGGRYFGKMVYGRVAHGFQSSPTSKGGRYRWGDVNHIPTDSVSILAHLERWALPFRVLGCSPATIVSILAHLERWALPDA